MVEDGLFRLFQSSFELMGYITSKENHKKSDGGAFQSSFELMGYITITSMLMSKPNLIVSKLFRAYGLYNFYLSEFCIDEFSFQSSFELMGYITDML